MKSVSLIAIREGKKKPNQIDLDIFYFGWGYISQ